MSRVIHFSIVLLLAASCTGADDRNQRDAITPEKVFDVTAHAVSSNGDFIVYVDYSRYPNLALSYFGREWVRALTHEREGYATGIAISPDNKTIVYGWEHEGYTLRVTDTNGSNHRVLVNDPKITWLRAPVWSHDGEQIAGVAFAKDGSSRPVLIQRSDGKLTSLKLEGQVDEVAFSPNDRYLAYVSSANEDPSFHKIMVHDRHTGKTVQAVPRADRFVGWTADGEGIVYFRLLEHHIDVWVQPLADGRPLGNAEFTGIRIDSSRLHTDRMRILGFSQSGDCYYSGSAWTNDVYLIDYDPENVMIGRPKRVVKQVGFDTSADFSPDGKSLAYAFGYGRNMRSMVVGIRSLESDEERRFPANMRRFGGHAFQLNWSPDGRSLRTQGWNQSREQGLFEIDLATQAVRPLLLGTEESATFAEWPCWSNDSAFFVRWTDQGPQRIIRLDQATGSEDEIYHPADPVAKVSHLAASPDGNQIAFVESNFEAGQTIIKVVPALGGAVRELARLPRAVENHYGQAVFALAWAHDSRSILYAPPDDDAQKLVLWQVACEGGDATALGVLLDVPRAFGLSVRHDGHQIALTAGESSTGGVWVLRDIGNWPQR